MSRKNTENKIWTASGKQPEEKIDVSVPDPEEEKKVKEGEWTTAGKIEEVEKTRMSKEKIEIKEKKKREVELEKTREELKEEMAGEGERPLTGEEKDIMDRLDILQENINKREENLKWSKSQRESPVAIITMEIKLDKLKQEQNQLKEELKTIERRRKLFEMTEPKTEDEIKEIKNQTAISRRELEETRQKYLENGDEHSLKEYQRTCVKYFNAVTGVKMEKISEKIELEEYDKISQRIVEQEKQKEENLLKEKESEIEKVEEAEKGKDTKEKKEKEKKRWFGGFFGKK